MRCRTLLHHATDLCNAAVLLACIVAAATVVTLVVLGVVALIGALP